MEEFEDVNSDNDIGDEDVAYYEEYEEEEEEEDGIKGVSGGYAHGMSDLEFINSSIVHDQQVHSFTIGASGFAGVGSNDSHHPNSNNNNNNSFSGTGEEVAREMDIGDFEGRDSDDSSSSDDDDDDDDEVCKNFLNRD